VSIDCGTLSPSTLASCSRSLLIIEAELRQDPLG
jgi:hypothetical protein